MSGQTRGGSSGQGAKARQASPAERRPRARSSARELPDPEEHGGEHSKSPNHPFTIDRKEQWAHALYMFGVVFGALALNLLVMVLLAGSTG